MSEPKLEFVAADYAYEEYIKKLIERDVPKVPKIIYGTICCPGCGVIFESVRGPYGNGPALHSYCPTCGQKLDWSRKKEKE